jgi:4-amino-4-deoxy-L-arabinose transferase-like glycosyltransferase
MPTALPVSLRILLVWLLLLIIALSTRPLMPIDETRYLSVAWEMWSRGDFLVMHLNGESYSHKPPLLFWIINFFWWIFGVNEWSARLVSPLFGLATLLLTAALAKRLWPEITEPQQTAPWLLLGAAAWCLLDTATMFDTMLAFFAVIAAWGIHLAWRQQSWHGWLLVTLAIGGGLLAKGPAILVSVLPLALLAPWWAEQPPARGWGHWYLALAAAICFGVAIALIWAIPAAIVGGPEYRDAIFWGQTANRIIESFAHQRPWWWYLPLLPVLLFPWLLWGKLWRALLQFNLDRSERFCIAWGAPVLIIFSLISGKQVHYLLPAFPAFALFAARRLTHLPPSQIAARQWGLGVMIIAMGIFAASVPFIYTHFEGPAELGNISPLWGGVVSVIGIGLICWRPRQMTSAVTGLSLTTASIIALLHLGVITAIAPAYELSATATRLANLQSEGKEIAHLNKYHGEYHFLGRLTAPLKELNTEDEIRQWAGRHGDGVIVIHYDPAAISPAKTKELEQQAIYFQDYRSERLALMPAAVYRQH